MVIGKQLHWTIADKLPIGRRTISLQVNRSRFFKRNIVENINYVSTIPQGQDIS